MSGSDWLNDPVDEAAFERPLRGRSRPPFEPAGIVRRGEYHFAPKPPLTTNRFTIADEITGGKINGVSVSDMIQSHLEDFYRHVDAGLEQKVAEHLRSKGWTVEPPTTTEGEAS